MAVKEHCCGCSFSSSVVFSSLYRWCVEAHLRMRMVKRQGICSCFLTWFEYARILRKVFARNWVPLRWYACSWNQYSNHPASHKALVVKALLSRANTICSSEEGRRRGKETIFSDLWKNGDTSSFMNHIARRQGLDWHRQPPTNAQSRPTTRICAPYIKGTSEAVARVLAKEGI